MQIGDKYYNNTDILTIYDIYNNSVKVKFNNDDKYSFIKKDELKNYRFIVPIGYMISFWVIPNDKEMIKYNFKDLVFIFDPNTDCILWDHSENCAPTLIKSRLSDAIFPSDNTGMKCMTMMDDDWILAKELDELSKLERHDYKRITMYIDTTLDQYIKLLQTTANKYNTILKESGKIIKDHYNEYFKQRSNIKELIEMLGLDNMLSYTLDFMIKDLSSVKNMDTDYGLKVFTTEDLEDIMVTYGLDMRDIIIIKYWYDLDINSISMKHQFIKDKNTGELFVMFFNSNGLCQKAINQAFSFEEQVKIFRKMEG